MFIINHQKTTISDCDYIVDNVLKYSWAQLEQVKRFDKEAMTKVINHLIFPKTFTITGIDFSEWNDKHRSGLNRVVSIFILCEEITYRLEIMQGYWTIFNQKGYKL